MMMEMVDRCYGVDPSGTLVPARTVCQPHFPHYQLARTNQAVKTALSEFPFHGSQSSTIPARWNSVKTSLTAAVLSPRTPLHYSALQLCITPAFRLSSARQMPRS